MTFSTPKPSGFNFGSPAAGAGSGFAAAALPQQQPSSFAFGTPTATVQPQQQQQPSTGLSFGLPQSNVPSNAMQPSSLASMAFSTPAAQSTGFAFGQQASNPAAANASTASMSFGLPNITPQSQQPATGLSFGQQPAQQPALGLSFGQPQVQQQQPAGLSFGQPTQPQQPVSALSFGQPTQQQPATGLSFGQPQLQQQSTGLSFGQPQSQPATTGFAFGQQAQTTATSTAAPILSFGLQTSSTTAAVAPTLTLNPLTTTTPSTGLSFAQPSSQAAPPLFGATQQQQQPSLLGSLTSQALVPSTTGTLTTSTVPQAVGLGGIDMNTTQPKAVEGKNESTKVKEAQVPKEIIQTVDDFKAYVKQQKTLSSDIIRTTDRKLKSVTDEIQRLNCNVQEVSNNVDNNKLTIKLLRSDTSKVIQHADMAQRTHETPSGLQFENIMPQIYFNELIHKYENDLLTLKHQVELTEKHLQSLSSPQNFSAQDLKRGLQQIHESFIALAGRLQETHTKVDSQKDQYLNLRKFLLRDTTNVFDVEQANKSSGANTSKVQYGPNPFTSSSLGGGLNFSNQSAAKQWNSSQTQPNNSSFFGNFKRM